LIGVDEATHHLALVLKHRDPRCLLYSRITSNTPHKPTDKGWTAAILYRTFRASTKEGMWSYLINTLEKKGRVAQVISLSNHRDLTMTTLASITTSTLASRAGANISEITNQRDFIRGNPKAERFFTNSCPAVYRNTLLRERKCNALLRPCAHPFRYNVSMSTKVPSNSGRPRPYDTLVSHSVLSDTEGFTAMERDTRKSGQIPCKAELSLLPNLGGEAYRGGKPSAR